MEWFCICAVECTGYSTYFTKAQKKRKENILQKLNKKDAKGKELYQQVRITDKTEGHKKVYGEVGTLAQLSAKIGPSERHLNRGKTSDNAVVRTNRKATKGRRVYVQTIKTGKSIRHVQLTLNALRRKTALIEVQDKIEVQKKKCHKKHPEFKKKE